MAPQSSTKAEEEDRSATPALEVSMGDIHARRPRLNVT
jgi:hypothetical protein